MEENSGLLDGCLAAVMQSKTWTDLDGKADILWGNMREGEQMMDKNKSSLFV